MLFGLLAICFYNMRPFLWIFAVRMCTLIIALYIKVKWMRNSRLLFIIVYASLRKKKKTTTSISYWPDRSESADQFGQAIDLISYWLSNFTRLIGFCLLQETYTPVQNSPQKNTNRQRLVQTRVIYMSENRYLGTYGRLNSHGNLG